MPRRPLPDLISSEDKRKLRRAAPWVAGGLVLLALVVWLAWRHVSGPVHMGVEGIRGLAANLRDILEPLGPFGPLLVILIFVAQVVFPPIPAPVVTVTVAIVYGPIVGFTLSYIGSLLGYTVAFWISRRYGRAKVAALEKRNERLNRVEAWVERRGAEAIFLLRLTPLSVSFDVLAYLAGLTRIRYVDFILASALGMIPSLVVLMVAGNSITNLDSLRILLDWRFLLLGVGVVVLFFVTLRYLRHRADRHEAEHDARLAGAEQGP